MPTKFEYISDDPKYPNIVLHTPVWSEVVKERRRSRAQKFEQKAQYALLKDEKARQIYLSPYWKPKNQGVEGSKKFSGFYFFPFAFPSPKTDLLPKQQKEERG